MAYNDREEKIMEILRGRQSVSNRELASRLYVSSATLRRDLDRMEQKGLITRFHGSTSIRFVAPDQTSPFEYREQLAFAEKQKIAKKAVSFIKNGDVIMMDGSTTAEAIVPFLQEFQDIIVITSGAKTAYLLGLIGIQTISTGGRMLSGGLSYVGSDALRTIRNYNADVAFFSCRALTPDGDLSDNSQEECDVRREMMKQARKSVLLIDNSKFFRSALVNFATLREIDEIVTNGLLPPIYADVFSKE